MNFRKRATVHIRRQYLGEDIEYGFVLALWINKKFCAIVSFAVIVECQSD